MSLVRSVPCLRGHARDTYHVRIKVVRPVNQSHRVKSGVSGIHVQCLPVGTRFSSELTGHRTLRLHLIASVAERLITTRSCTWHFDVIDTVKDKQRHAVYRCWPGRPPWPSTPRIISCCMSCIVRAALGCSMYCCAAAICGRC